MYARSGVWVKGVCKVECKVCCRGGVCAQGRVQGFGHVRSGAGRGCRGRGGCQGWRGEGKADLGLQPKRTGVGLGQYSAYVAS